MNKKKIKAHTKYREKPIEVKNRAHEQDENIRPNTNNQHLVEIEIEKKKCVHLMFTNKAHFRSPYENRSRTSD